jgi:mono/diheme cytochrome c family protein
MLRSATVLVSLLSILVSVGCDSSTNPSAGGGPGDVARGQYLVTEVALCQDCHAARGPDGQFLADRWLLGQPLPFQPSAPMPVWADIAPPIAGLYGYTDEQAMTVLTQGVGKLGQTLRPPMPAYRFNARDAKDVLAYLRSLAK